MICYSARKLAREGYTPVDRFFEEAPTHSECRALLIELDLQYGSLTAFRIAPGRWQVFRTSEALPGFVDLPLLPF